MRIKNLFLEKKNLLLPVVILAFIISGLAEPVVKNYLVENWNQTLIERVIRNESKVVDILNKKIQKLIEAKNDLINSIRTELPEKNSTKNCFSILSDPNFTFFNIQINDNSGKPVCWNNKIIFGDQDFQNIRDDLGQVYFIRKDLSTYLYVIDTIKTGSATHFITIGQEIEKHYRLESKNYTFENLTDFLSKLISTNIRIDYNRGASKSLDGRQHSFFLLNNYNNKIGVATFEKPSLDISVKELEDNFKVIQSVLLLLIYLSVGFIGVKYYKRIENKNIQFIILLLYISILRIFLFYTGIPSSFLHNELTDPSNFSSSFAFGIVRSPLDFFITMLGLVVVITVGYNRFRHYYEKKVSKKNTLKFAIIFFAASLLIFMLYRSVGASLRSVVFDSTIRYFKEFSLIPSPAIFLMDLNILLLGFCTILFSILLLKWILFELPVREINFQSILILYFVFQFLGWIFDSFQVQPQGTLLIRILFITLLFLITYLTINKPHKTLHYIYYGFASAILVVNLFVYYNSELERESLRTVAYDLTRRNQNIYEFILYQTLLESKNSDQILNYGEGKINYSAVAFEIWNKSLLFRENIPSSISIYNSGKELLGSFSSYNNSTENNFAPFIQNVDGNPKIYREKVIYNSSELFIGVTGMGGNGDSGKIIVITALFKDYNLGEETLPKFLTVTREGMTSATEYDNLKIFVFSHNELINSFGGVKLNSNEAQELLTDQSDIQSEKWKRIEIKGEPYLVFTLKPREKENELIAVALEERRFAWNLSNFFKVFFVHSIIILFVFILYAARYFNRWKEYFQRYKTKLTFAFILVSVVPLLIIAAYIRIINENKNEELINGYLTEFTEQLNSYYKKYNTSSSLSLEPLFEKANADLNIDFNCYDSYKLIYSTKKYFYESGILSSTLIPEAYLNTIVLGGNKLFVKENNYGEEFYSVYMNINDTNRPLILSVNTLMNKASVPLRDVELDIFLFGILAVALILLIIFSTILADQISSPIRRLTHATRSIGSGDLNFEIEETGSGEIGELSKGFNMMIGKLKKSQVELAQLERETAWKEMAKQVAHEIKNPLTPMKLSVQQLITAYKDKSPKFDEIFSKVTNTVINQIETLKNIASEFSNFARMPKPSIEKIDLIPLTKETLNLFADEKSEIKFDSEITSLYINADADHLSRAIINLVRNSIQANATVVNVNIKSQGNICEIRVADNGTGINPDISEKIFEANFTTKSRGMGLGLSMAKKFIESIGGTIIIEKTSHEGTTFLILIPVAE